MSKMRAILVSIIIFSLCLVFLFSSPEQVLADDGLDVFHLTPLEQNKKPFLNFVADGPVSTVKISGNDKHVAAGTQVGDKKGSVYYFDNNGTLLWKYTADRQILQVAVSSDGKYLAAAGSQFYHYGTYGPAGWNNGEVYYFDGKGNLLWKYDGTGSVAVTNIAISEDGSYVAVGSDKAILYFDKNGNLLWTYPVTRSNDHTVSISPDGSYVATKDDAVVEFLDNHGNQLWSYTAGHGTEENVSAGSSYLTMSPDGRYVITSDYADGVLLFDDTGKIVLAKNTGKHFFYQSISYDGSFIAASAQQWGESDPGATYLFDKNGTVLWSYPGDMRSVVSGDGRYVLGGIWNSGLALFFLDDKGNLLWNSNAGNVNSLDVSYDGTLSVVGTGFGNDNGHVLFFNQNRTDTTEPQPIADFVKKDLDTPLKQFKSGISSLDVKCKIDFVHIIKAEDNSPACVKPDTVDILVKRGWAKPITIPSGNEPHEVFPFINNTNIKNNNPFGITALVIYHPFLGCLSPGCPPNNFYLKINSNTTAYLTGYNICDKDSCARNSTLSVLLPINTISNPDYARIELPENLHWKNGDVVSIQLKVTPTVNNETGLLVNLGNSTIVP